jgi:hypothetical protein
VNVTYTVYIEATNSTCATSSASISVLTVYPPPDPPTNFVQVVAQTTTTATQVTWSQTGQITNYNYSVSNGGPSANGIGVVTSQNVTGLSADSQYTFNLTPINGLVTGGTVQFTLTTAPGPPNPSQVSATDTTVTVRWTSKSWNTYTYQLGGGSESGSISADYIVSGGMSGGNNYQFKLVSRNPFGNSSATITIYTAPGALTIAYSSATYNSITITLSGGNGANSYTVRYTKVSTGVTTTITGVATSSPYTTPASLETNTTYSIRVLAVNSYGSTDSNIITPTTANIPPPPKPTGLQITNVGAYSARFSWNGDSTGLTTYYAYSFSNGPSGTITGTPLPSTLNQSGLGASTAYSFNLVPYNTVVEGPSTISSFTTLPRPDAMPIYVPTSAPSPLFGRPSLPQTQPIAMSWVYQLHTSYWDANGNVVDESRGMSMVLTFPNDRNVYFVATQGRSVFNVVYPNGIGNGLSTDYGIWASVPDDGSGRTINIIGLEASIRSFNMTSRRKTNNFGLLPVGSGFSYGAVFANVQYIDGGGNYSGDLIYWDNNGEGTPTTLWYGNGGNTRSIFVWTDVNNNTNTNFRLVTTHMGGSVGNFNYTRYIYTLTSGSNYTYNVSQTAYVAQDASKQMPGRTFVADDSLILPLAPSPKFTNLYSTLTFHIDNNYNVYTTPIKDTNGTLTQIRSTIVTYPSKLNLKDYHVLNVGTVLPRDDVGIYAGGSNGLPLEYYGSYLLVAEGDGVGGPDRFRFKSIDPYGASDMVISTGTTIAGFNGTDRGTIFWWDPSGTIYYSIFWGNIAPRHNGSPFPWLTWLGYYGGATSHSFG